VELGAVGIDCVAFNHPQTAPLNLSEFCADFAALPSRTDYPRKSVKGTNVFAKSFCAFCAFCGELCCGLAGPSDSPQIADKSDKNLKELNRAPR
jgi:hypothetical protein